MSRHSTIYGALDGARLIKGRASARKLGMDENAALSAEFALTVEEKLQIAIEAIGRLEHRLEIVERQAAEAEGEAGRAISRMNRYGIR